MLDTYVTDESGTGVVHQAPYFGEVCCFLHHYKRYLILQVLSTTIVSLNLFY